MRGSRVAVYTDYVYRREAGAVFTERAFALFIAEVGTEFDRLVVLGRLDPTAGRWHYRLPPEVEFVGLPHYAALSRPLLVARAAAGSLQGFWRATRDVDVVWVLGPGPLAIAFVVMAKLSGGRVVLGVRQDLPEYVRSRHPGRRWMLAAASLLERAFRRLAAANPVIVVGPGLAHAYRESTSDVLEIAVSLVRDRDLLGAAEQQARRYDGELRLLSVGRLDTEKNPLLLADILAGLRARDPRWRLIVCGEGPLRGELEARLGALGLAEHADLMGYVPLDDGLLDLYRGSHAFLHVSWTEGLPQVLFEAFASRVPVVATAVGGVADAAGDAAILIEPGNADAAVAALSQIAADASLRSRLTDAGAARVTQSTLEAEARRVARFLSRDLPASPTPA